MPTPWPSANETTRMVADLLAGTATTPSEIATAFLILLSDHVRWRFPFADPEQCEMAAADAIWAVIRRPNSYDPNRLEFGRFLRLVARRKMLNLLDRETKHAKKISLQSVAEPAERGNCSQSHNSPSWDDPRLIAEIAGFNQTDQTVLDMMRRGERSTRTFAQALGLSRSSPSELAAEVKRYKDRLKKRLARAVGGAE